MSCDLGNMFNAFFVYMYISVYSYNITFYYVQLVCL